MAAFPVSSNSIAVMLRRSLTTQVLLCVLGPAVLHISSASGQSRPSEDEVKAAYLFNFGRFVRRPPTSPPQSTFDICILGQVRIAAILGKTTVDQRLDDRVVRIRTLEDPTEARSCAIAFFGQSEVGRLDKEVAALRGADVLTVSDIPNFRTHGGMVEFLFQGNRIRFAVNLDAVNGTKLQLGSELLRVAAAISGEPRREVPQ